MLQRQRLPGPVNRYFGFEHLRQIRRDIFQFASDLSRDYGDVLHYRILGRNVFHFRLPEHAHEILATKSKVLRKSRKRAFRRVLGGATFTIDGEAWASRRRIMQPIFQPHVLERFKRVVLRQSQSVFDMLQGPEVNISSAMSQITLMSIAEALFGRSTVTVVDELQRAIATMEEVATKQVTNPFSFPLFIPTPDNRLLRSALRSVHGIAGQFIEECKSRGESEDNLVSLLLRATNEKHGIAITEREIRAEAISLMFAGGESTAAALSWAASLLAQHPDVLDKVYKEIVHIAGAGPLLPQHAQDLHLTESVFKEAMRIHPPVPILTRRASETVQIGEITIPRGSLVLVFIHAMHHDERWFRNPDNFQPERFSPSRAEEFVENSYMPFGAGPRACLGKGFAMMEGPLVLADLIRRYSFTLSPSKGPPVPEFQINMRPQGGTWLQLQPRAVTSSL